MLGVGDACPGGFSSVPALAELWLWARSLRAG